MFQFNREDSARNIDWVPKKLQYIEAWSFNKVNTVTPWNFRSGFLDSSQLGEWLYQSGSFSIPAPPSCAGNPVGGIRLLACDYTLFNSVSLGMSFEDFQLVESSFKLHPATLSSLEVASGTFSRHFKDSNQRDHTISLILKAPQKYEIANYMLSLTHDTRSHWTTALLAGENITDHLSEVDSLSGMPFAFYSPCATVRAFLTRTPGLWNRPLTLPCILLTDHLKRLRKHCAGDLTQSVMFIEEQLGVTRVGRRSQRPSSHGRRMARDAAGEPLERPQAQYLTVNINTQLTRLLFTKRAPKWNHEASEFLRSIDKELAEVVQDPTSMDGQLSELLEHNIHLAKSTEDHVIGLQNRLELQLNVLYSFVAQTDNRLNARLAATSGRDSTSMKILAFITTIFLPGTFVATLFSMNMFNWEDGAPDSDSSDSVGPTVSSRFWIYWATSVPLTALTLGGWALWWSFEKRRYDEHIEETVKGAQDTWWWRRVLRNQEKPGSATTGWPLVPAGETRGPRRFTGSTVVAARSADRTYHL